MRLFVRLAYFPATCKLITRLCWGREYRALMNQTIPGSYDYTGNFKRDIELDEKYAAIKSEFHGSSELCFEIVRRIIQIRRGVDQEKNWLYIFGAVLNHPDAIFSRLTLRWIISVLDTFSDMPCPLRYKLAAGNIRSFTLGLRLGYSMAVQSVSDPRVNDRPVHFMRNKEIWDGIIHFNYRGGDTYRNYIQRTADELKSIPCLASAWRATLLRVAKFAPMKFALTNNERSRAVFETVTSG